MTKTKRVSTPRQLIVGAVLLFALAVHPLAGWYRGHFNPVTVYFAVGIVLLSAVALVRAFHLSLRIHVGSPFPRAPSPADFRRGGQHGLAGRSFLIDSTR